MTTRMLAGEFDESGVAGFKSFTVATPADSTARQQRHRHPASPTTRTSRQGFGWFALLLVGMGFGAGAMLMPRTPAPRIARSDLGEPSQPAPVTTAPPASVQSVEAPLLAPTPDSTRPAPARHAAAPNGRPGLEKSAARRPRPAASTPLDAARQADDVDLETLRAFSAKM